MSTSVDTMKNFFNILKLYANDQTADGVEVLDHAIRTTTRFAGLQDAVNHFVADMAYVTATQGAAQSLLQNCGIVLGADYDFSVDTGAVSGWNAGMGVVKNAQDIVPESGTLENVPLPAVNGSTSTHSYTGADGQTFYYTVTYPNDYFEVIDFSTASLDADGNIIESTAQTNYLQAGQTYSTVERISGKTLTYTGEEHASSILTMLKGMDNYWLDESFKLAYDSFGLDFNNKNISLQFAVNSPYKFSAATGPINKALEGLESLPIDEISMYINATMFTNLDASDPNGNTYNANSGNCRYLDRVVAHEMIHAVMFAAGLFKENMPQFFTEGVAELVQGLDDYDGKNRQYFVGFAEDASRLAAALEFREGTGTNEAYPAGEMFLRYLCHQSLPTEITVGNGNVAGLFEYDGGEEILSGVASGSQINAANGVQLTNANMAGDDLFVTSNAGTLIIRDAGGKLINFAGEDGNVAARFFAATEEGTIDGRSLNGYEIINGANFLSNEIYAGSGGSRLWGGSYGSDYLHGGAGVDEFIAGVGCGHDNIFGAFTEDRINLAATTLSQIASVNVIGSVSGECDIFMNFTDGSSTTVWSAADEIVNFRLADGSEYSHINATDTWIQTK